MTEPPLIDFDGTFFRGMKSDSDPGQLALGYYWYSFNTINTGGVISCRPGYRCVVQLPDGNLQGGALFRPDVGLEQLVVCIDGIVYTSEWPFISWRVLPNVLMSPTAKQIYWALTKQSVTRATTDFGSRIDVIRPRPVLFMQDGGSTAPAWYDGSNSGHVRDNPYETPAGGPMMWVGDRLWVAKGNLVLASDISNPFSFREDIYLGGVSGFTFSQEVTALAKTPSLETPQLVVFTRANASIVQANIRDRDTWPDVAGMQVEILQAGCESQRSVVNHFGRLSWLSPSGVVLFDFATGSKLSVRIPIRDNELIKSKSVLSPDLSLVAGASFGQYMLLSTPAEDLFNQHTWVLNDCSYETLSDDSGPAWSSVWTGTRPVEWVWGDIAGSNRIYHVSTDDDGKNRLWEAFRPDRLDNGCPITWAVFTRGYFGPTGIVKREPGSDMRMGFADIALVGISDDLDLGVFYAGGVRGAFKRILGKRFNVARGNVVYDQEITATTELFACKAQGRIARTEDAHSQGAENDTGSCGPETTRIENVDENFQLLIVGQGPATLRWVKVFGYAEGQEYKGDAKACEDEEEYNAVRFDGAGASGENVSGTLAELAARPFTYFTANQVASVSQDGKTAIGAGFAESVISQSAADRVASRIATRVAEVELAAMLPNVLSVGKGLE